MSTMQNTRIDIRLTMTGAEFKAWRSLMGWSMRETGSRLGINRNTVLDYEHNGAPERIRLACRALAIDEKKVATAVVYPWERAT